MTTTITGGEIPLRQGVRYRARLRLSGFLGCSLPVTQLVNGLTDTGFADVGVYTSETALPPDWPDDQREIFVDPGAQQCARWIEGTWGLGDQTAPRSMFEPEGPGVSVTLLSLWAEDDQPGPTQVSSGARPRNVREADKVLRLAWQIEKQGAAFPRETRHALLSIALFEGGWGNSSYILPDGSKVDNANNWGAMHCPPAGGGGQRTVPRPGELWDHCVRGGDRKTADGERFEVFFRGYATPLAGARDFIRLSSPAHDAMSTGNADAIARRMKEVWRYGVPISDYADAIAHNAEVNAANLGEDNAIFREASGSARTALILAGVGTVVALGALGVYLWAGSDAA